jgi:hypothetical protein
MPRTLNPEAAVFISAQGPPSNGYNGNRNYRTTHYNDPVPNANPLEYMGTSNRHITPSYYITSGTPAEVTANDIDISNGGISEVNPVDNGGNATAHVWYFNYISGCY